MLATREFIFQKPGLSEIKYKVKTEEGGQLLSMAIQFLHFPERVLVTGKCVSKHAKDLNKHATLHTVELNLEDISGRLHY